jgi:putative ABC transport system ATP-binding protein
MMRLMTSLAYERKQTLVLVTHNPEISEYSTRIVRVRDGKIEKIENGRDNGYETKNA